MLYLVLSALAVLFWFGVNSRLEPLVLAPQYRTTPPQTLKQVGTLQGNDTSFASSFVVAPIWAKLQNKTGMEFPGSRRLGRLAFRGRGLGL